MPRAGGRPSAARTATALERIAARLRDRCAGAAGRLGLSVACAYNPLEYAWEAHRAYLQMARHGPEVLFVGMNPGPFGMVQTGVPFGEVASVREFLGIDGRAVRIGAPVRMHPKRPVLGFGCTRSEVSGARVWSWARGRFGTADAFFRHAFIWNWCPLAFMSEGGANLTPDRLPRGGTSAAAVRDLEAACDEALGEAIAALAPHHVVGFGAFARARAAHAVQALSNGPRALRPVPVHQVLHPSPASPAANRGWARQVDAQLAAAGIRLGAPPILPVCASRSSTSSGSRRASSRAGSARTFKSSRADRAASGR